MNLFTPWLLIQTRRLFSTFLLTVTLLISSALSSGNGIQAMAQSLMPNADYQVAARQGAESVPQWYPKQEPIDSMINRMDADRPDQTIPYETRNGRTVRQNEAPAIDLDNNQTKRAQQNLKRTTDNVRENLNLDAVQDRVSDTVEGTKRTLKDTADTITGDR